jgi:hypothetical protein
MPTADECNDDPTLIDIMVLYTPAAIAVNATESAMQARVNQAVADTNWAFTDSNVQTQLRLVHMGAIDYNGESAPLQSTLNVLTSPTDPGPDADTLDSVHPLRDQVHADLVILIISQPGFARGLSNGMYLPNVGTWFKTQAFAIVTEAGLSSYGGYYFAHEVGHLMGSNHETSNGGAFAHSRGSSAQRLRQCSGWGTIMAQPVCSTCEPLRLWSTPKVSYCGQSIGVDDVKDNARSLNDTRGVVANFFCAPR